MGINHYCCGYWKNDRICASHESQVVLLIKGPFSQQRMIQAIFIGIIHNMHHTFRFVNVKYHLWKTVK